MVLHLIGLGLGQPEDLTVYGISLMRCCTKLYLHTSHYLQIDKGNLLHYLETLFDEPIPVYVDETYCRLPAIVLESKKENIGILMPGNPFFDDFYPRIKCYCQRADVKIIVAHNMSYINVLGNSGIQWYKFGKSVLIELHCTQEHLKHHIAVINSNLKRNLNTLVLFDTVDENPQRTKLLFNDVIDPTLKFTRAVNDHHIIYPGNKDNILLPETKVVFLYEQNGRILFDCRPISGLEKIGSIKALAVISEFDCVEEEYLKKMENFKNSERPGKEGVGNFNVIGLGLGKPEDVTLKGRNLIEKSHKIFLEGYTSIMRGGKDDLEKFFGKEIIVADREMVEQNSDAILGHLENGDVSFLVVGDPFGATTHTDMIIRSLKHAKDIVIANNASIINAIGICGLKPSKFSTTVSIPFWTDTYKPDSFYDKIAANKELGCHTLCLLDIQVREQSFENLARGRKIYEKPRFMSVCVAAQQLLEISEKRRKENEPVCVLESSPVICFLRIGTEEEKIVVKRLGELLHEDFGEPLHSLAIVGSLDDDEKSSLEDTQVQLPLV